MNTIFSIQIDDVVLKQAESAAQMHQRELASLVQDYVTLLAHNHQFDYQFVPSAAETPVLAALSGALTNDVSESTILGDANLQHQHREHQVAKHSRI
jgi:phosphoglucomutase